MHKVSLQRSKTAAFNVSVLAWFIFHDLFKHCIIIIFFFLLQEIWVTRRAP